VYLVKGGKHGSNKMHDYYFKESTVKAAKELVSAKLQQNQSLERVTLETVRDSVGEVKREQTALKGKLADIEEKIQTVLEIMASRNAPVERY